MDPDTRAAVASGRGDGVARGEVAAGIASGNDASTACASVSPPGRSRRTLRGAQGDTGANASPSLPRHRYTVCMVCDFFFPRLGGVEMHIWSQAQCLMAMGHKVIVVTNAHGKRRGVRWMTNGLKVYYIPLLPFVDGSSLPTLGLAYFPLFRRILIREGVDIVHGHQVRRRSLRASASGRARSRRVVSRRAALLAGATGTVWWWLLARRLRPWRTSAF